MLFLELAQAFEEIRSHSARLIMTKQLAHVFTHASPEESGIIAYFALGQLRATYQGSTQFQMATRSMIPVLAEVMEEDEETISERFSEVGDLGDVIAVGRWRSKKELTVGELYELLSTWEEITGSGSQKIKHDSLVHLLRQLSPIEAALVVRIVIGKLRLGFSDMTIIDALSWMLVGDKSLRKEIEHAYSLCADIGRIAEIVRRDGIVGIKKIKSTLGIPLRPAAAERLPTAEAVFEKLGPCVAQPKLDGFRVQVHISHPSGTDQPLIRCFSRNLHDMTGMFPDLEKGLLCLADHDLIIEGEAIASHEETGELLSFQETVKRKRKHGIEEMSESHPLKLVLFDILSYEGSLLLEEPHHIRYALLQKLAKKCDPSVIMTISERKIDSVTDLEHYFIEVVSEGLEGLVVKRDDAPYEPGVRNANWIKLKRHEIGQLEDTIDAVVLGYYAGRGKRAKFGIGALLVGVYDAHYDRYVTIARLGTGLSDETLRMIKHRCDGLRVAQKPVNVSSNPIHDPDVWIEPRLVVEVAADEITRSPVHTAGRDVESAYGFALRFPRMIKLREDKSISDITTVDEVRKLFGMQKREREA